MSLLVWWAFAFAPLSSTPPAWLSAARYACFGAADNGLPAAHGWMLLVLGPLSFLIGIVVLWGGELPRSLGAALHGRGGRVLAAALAVALVFEGVWVTRKIDAARAVSAWAAGMDDAGALPADYPRATAPAPEFSLVDQHGQTLSLERFRGGPVALTFVFAHCETLCPLIVETLKQAAPGTPALTVLLVTLDPWRDTPSTLPTIANSWSLPDGFHVLSARHIDDVLRTTERYGVPFTRDEATGEITHPGLVFLIDGDGRLAYTFNNPSSAWVREAVQRLGRAGVRAG